jgi:hypothetical protein
MSKKIAYSILVFFFFLTVSLYAQESSPTDDIVVKAANAVIFQMTANLKLTEDQISAARPIIADNIAKVRNLQQSLEDGTIESSAMYSRRQGLINDESQELSSVLTTDQMRIWLSMQNPSDDNHARHGSSK